MPETTTKQFEHFKRRFLEWRDFWGLKEWRVGFRHVATDSETEDFLAWTVEDLDSMQLGVYLSKEWGEGD